MYYISFAYCTNEAMVTDPKDVGYYMPCNNHQTNKEKQNAVFCTRHVGPADAPMLQDVAVHTATMVHAIPVFTHLVADAPDVAVVKIWTGEPIIFIT